jgi:hypothetical protein
MTDTTHDDLVMRLYSLHKQATVERSHFYVGRCVADAIDRIAALEAKLAQQTAMTDQRSEELSTIVITDTVEHEDGSATYTFDMDDASQKKVTELGLEFILTCAAYGLDIQDALEDIRWAGQQRELKKKLMEDCDKEFGNGTGNT